MRWLSAPKALRNPSQGHRPWKKTTPNAVALKAHRKIFIT